MLTFLKLAVLLFITVVQCSPFDDGKYNPKKYSVNDDGKYYRPLNEGKYVPGDEGKYTYVYKQGLYPTDDGDYRYVHQVGPDGGKGGFGGTGGFGGEGGFGPGGPNGPKGPGGPSGPGGRTPNAIEYIGRKNYAGRYPYIHKVIKSLVDEYTSSDYLTSEGSSNHYSKVYSDKEVALKCRYLSPSQNQTEFVTQYPPSLKVNVGDKQGSYYSFKGTKVLNTVENALTSKLKLEYEVFVRIVEEVS